MSRKYFLFPFLLLFLANCTPTITTEKSYVVYDIKNIDRTSLEEAVTDKMKKRVTKIMVNKNIPPKELPKEPTRFDLASFGNSATSVFAALIPEMPVCPKATLTLQATNNSLSKYGRSTSHFACVIPYEEGYTLNYYNSLTERTGLDPVTLGAALYYKVTADDPSREFRITQEETLEVLINNGAQVELLESYP